MIIRQYPVELSLNYPLEQQYELDRILFFDIETTGLAADNTYLYLIGCIYHKEGSFYMLQWFSEGIGEEIQIIKLFLDFLKDYDVLVHYNGSGFDIPYLKRKCGLYGLEDSLSRPESLDIYKIITPVKKLLRLNNYRQKSLEHFLNIKREDTMDGGDLIQVYSAYLGKKHYETLRKSRLPGALCGAVPESELLLSQLLLHNADDLKGLLQICPIMYYADLLVKPIRILGAAVDGDKLTVRFELSFTLPARVSLGNETIFFTVTGNTAALSVLVYEGELKHFYDNYKDYYYLPKEDTAVHKSLAMFVDKEYRQKAKASDCYVRRQGIFVPQYDTIISPYFKSSFQDKLTFLEVHTDSLLKEEKLEIYVFHILKQLLAGK